MHPVVVGVEQRLAVEAVVLDHELALVGRAVAEGPVAQCIGGPDAAGVLRRVGQRVAFERVAVGRGIAAGRTRVVEAVLRHAAHDFAVEISVVGVHRPFAGDVAGGAQRDAVDVRAAIERLFAADVGRVRIVDPVVFALVAEQRGGQRETILDHVPFAAQFDIDRGLRIDVAVGGTGGAGQGATAVDRRLRRRLAVGVGQIEAAVCSRLEHQAGAVREQVFLVGGDRIHAGQLASGRVVDRIDDPGLGRALVVVLTRAEVQQPAVAELERVEDVERPGIQFAFALGAAEIVLRPGPDVVGAAERLIGITCAGARHRAAVGVEKHAAGFQFEGFGAERHTGHQRMLDAAGREVGGEIGLVDRDAVTGVAHQTARSAHRGPGACRLSIGAGLTGVRVGAVFQTPVALQRGHVGQLIHALHASERAHRHLVVEVVLEHRREHVHVDLLFGDIAIAEIGLRVDARQRTVVVGVQRERNAVLRQVVVALVQVGQRDPRIRAQPDRQRGREAPALEVLVVAARHVVLVRHRVEAQRGAVLEIEVAVGRDAPITVAAEAQREGMGIAFARGLAHQIDVAADRTGTGNGGVGAVDQFDRFQIEGIAARVLGAVADTVGGDVAAGGEAAQIDAVAVTAAAFAGAEGDAGQGAEHIAQAEQVLLVHHCLGHHRDGLRRVQKRLGVFHGAGLLLAFSDDFDLVEFLDAGTGIGGRFGVGVGAEGERERRDERLQGQDRVIHGGFRDAIDGGELDLAAVMQES